MPPINYYFCTLATKLAPTIQMGQTDQSYYNNIPKARKHQPRRFSSYALNQSSALAAFSGFMDERTQGLVPFLLVRNTG